MIRDIVGPIDLPGQYLWIWILLGILLLAGLAYLAYWFFIKRPLNNVERKRLTPWELAYKQLEGLLDRDLPRSGKIKEFYSELADIVRLYIEGRFELNAPDMTTEEFFEIIKKEEKLNVDHRHLLQGFLNCCDLVKFAKYGPSRNEIDESTRLAKKFVDETRIITSPEEE